MTVVDFRAVSFLLVGVMTLFCWVGGLSLGHASERAYHGVVVDAETKAPLEGAVVVVIWYRKPLLTMDGPQYLHKAVEVLTGPQGRFSVAASPGIDWDPFTTVKREPRIVIFRPGYGPFPVAQVRPRSVTRFGETRNLNLAELNAELLNGAVVELPTLKTTEEIRKFTEPGDMWFAVCGSASRVHCVPPDLIPNFLRLIDIQRASINLEPYVLGGGQSRREED